MTLLPCALIFNHAAPSRGEMQVHRKSEQQCNNFTKPFSSKDDEKMIFNHAAPSRGKMQVHRKSEQQCNNLTKPFSSKVC